MLFCVSKSDIFNFADDNTLSPCGKILGDILHNFKLDIRCILKCFKVNSLKQILVSCGSWYWEQKLTLSKVISGWK